MAWYEWLLLIPYVLCGVLLMVYGFNCYWQIGFFLRGRRFLREQSKRCVMLEEELWMAPENLPIVTTQIPLYNEFNVADRILRSVAALDYPKHLHQVQVLDDSTDGTRELIEKTAGELREEGVWIEVIHRQDRSGFKAGALKNGLEGAKGEYVAIFDGDFVPRKDFLRRTLPLLVKDSGLGMVQGRWDHLNPTENLLCRAQVLGIDGHFTIEQAARASNGLFLNFNGTAGIWRKQAIFDSGNWEGDTLTEDMDLSYRAQLKGWRLAFSADAVVPAELPATFTAFKNQQFRWAKGSIQTALKLFPRVWRSDKSIVAKLQALFHLTHYTIHPAIVAIALLSLPMLLILPDEMGVAVRLFGFLGILVAALGPNTLYFVSQRVLHPDTWLRRIVFLPVLTAIGLGISVSNARAVLEGYLGVKSEFVRTPKKGTRNTVSYKSKASWVTGMELFMACYCGVALGFFFWLGAWGITPFLVLYTMGYGYVGIRSLGEIAGSRPRRRIKRASPMEARSADASG